MKKIIFKAIIFLLILFLMLLILSRIFVPKNNTKKAGIPSNRVRQVGVLAEPENTLDVICVGDSEAYTSFIPLEAWNKYGYTTYVCGYPAQRIPSILSIVQQTLTKQKPKIIMLEANSLYRRNPASVFLAQIAYRILPIMEYHNRWKSLTTDDLFKEVKYTNIQRDKGFYLSKKIKAGNNEKYMEDSKKVSKIQRTNKLYVKILKEMCDRKGIELVIYSTPAPANWTTGKHNGIEKLAKEMGVEYIDMNLIQDKLKIDWTTDTRDEGDHLNYTGSLKATEFLAEYLNKKNLPDHRSDEKYKKWNECYNKYIKEINKQK